MNKVYTSYFSKVSKMDTSGYYLVAITRARVPSWFTKQCLWMPEYSPSWFLLNIWKKGEISWDKYTEIYNREMRLPERSADYKANLENLSDHVGKPVVLLCYEKEQCHRFILGKAIGAVEL